MIVVDASVAVKWLTAEKGGDTANSILTGGEDLAGPSLLRVEAAAAITRKALFGEITPEAAYRSLDVWSDIVHGIVVLIPEDHDLPAALKLALELNHPLQDCIYLALAERFDAPLVTADEKFAAKAHARYPRVRLLSQSPAR